MEESYFKIKWLGEVPFYHPPRKLREGTVFSQSTEGRGPHLTTAHHDAIGESQVTWRPPQACSNLFIGEVGGWPPTERPFCFMYDFLRKRSNKVISYLAMERSNSPRNCRSDVWYMTLTNDISVMRKYRMLPLVATGRYSSRALLILISVSAAICSFWLTSSAVVLVTLSTLIRSSSSTREP